MPEALLVLTLCLVGAQDKQPPAKAAVPAKDDGPLVRPAPEDPGKFASKEIEDVVTKVRQGMLMDAPRDNFILKETRTTYRNGSRSVTEVETRVNGVYTKVTTKQPNGAEGVGITSPQGYFTVSRGGSGGGGGRGRGGPAPSKPGAGGEAAPAEKNAWQVSNQGPMDKYLEEQVTYRQRQPLREPSYFFDIRFITNRPDDRPARYVIADEISRHNDAIEKVTKIEEGGKTLYRLFWNVRENEIVTIDADPEQRWAIVKVHAKGTNAPECEYTIELQKLANGNPFLKRFHVRHKDAGKEWRDVSTVEYALQEGTKADPAEYRLAFYGLTPANQPWDPWAIGLMVAAAGVVLVAILWYLVSKRGPAGTPSSQSAAAP